MKALVAIATYGNRNDNYLRRLVDEYRSMSFDVDLVVLSNIPKHVGEGVEVIVVPRRPWSHRGTSNERRTLRTLRQEYRDWVRQMDLFFAHTQVFANRLNNYDLFLYSEDDTLVTERNLLAFLAAAAVLPANEIPGFLRFERSPDGSSNYPEIHGHFHWELSSVRQRGGYTFASFTNEHAACYVVTREQLRQAIDSGGFLVEPHRGRYDMGCTAATDIYTQCGFQKLICVSRLDEFLIHHLPNKYVGTEFGVDDAELRRQVERLSRIGTDGDQHVQLFETETKLPDRSFSKGYYEAVRPELMSELPGGALTVLSVGSGSGAAEVWMANKGLQVSAMPLDAVVSRGAEADGVEIIGGDFEEAFRKLEGRQFDCLFLSNVLHLVPDPVALLSLFGSLLPPGGTAIAAVANTSRLELSWSAVRGGRIVAREMYRSGGVQHTSRETVRNWFESAGFHVQRMKQILGPQAEKIGRLTKGILDSWLAYEFVIAGRKAFEETVECETKQLPLAGR